MLNKRHGSHILDAQEALMHQVNLKEHCRNDLRDTKQDRHVLSFSFRNP